MCVTHDTIHVKDWLKDTFTTHSLLLPNKCWFHTQTSIPLATQTGQSMGCQHRCSITLSNIFHIKYGVLTPTPEIKPTCSDLNRLLNQLFVLEMCIGNQLFDCCKQLSEQFFSLCLFLFFLISNLTPTFLFHLIQF